MKSIWIEKNPYVYVDKDGYEILIEEEVDDFNNLTGRYELTIWLAKGGYYENISIHNTFNEAVEAQEKWIKDNSFKI
jgi:hypothetical protein